MATLAALENLGVARSAFGTSCPRIRAGKRHSLHFELLMKFIPAGHVEVTIYRLTSSEGIGNLLPCDLQVTK